MTDTRPYFSGENWCNYRGRSCLPLFVFCLFSDHIKRRRNEGAGRGAREGGQSQAYLWLAEALKNEAEAITAHCERGKHGQKSSPCRTSPLRFKITQQKLSSHRYLQGSFFSNSEEHGGELTFRQFNVFN